MQKIEIRLDKFTAINKSTYKLSRQLISKGTFSLNQLLLSFHWNYISNILPPQSSHPSVPPSPSIFQYTYPSQTVKTNDIGVLASIYPIYLSNLFQFYNTIVSSWFKRKALNAKIILTKNLFRDKLMRDYFNGIIS